MQEIVLTEILFVIGSAIVLAFVDTTILKRFGTPQYRGFILAAITLGLIGIASKDIIDEFRLIVLLLLN